ncbi:chorismate synthase [Acidaminobacter sp. JC074]|uniref:chorismate synthase n=1 Tax=Acidaminobacter sp. JC074 TaxID=2530199 RepID=UPI001F0DD82A|nr:chorismate synthase [Acidaminobacter sp. JC074]MCH4889985.1 chorismate synthase [Acidaminobacter sp. JC074]
MSGIWKSNLGLSIFGESHGPMVGITMTGVKAGHKLDLDFIQSELNRRKPGKSLMETQRREDDLFKIVSGEFNGFTTGAPLTMMIENTNQRSRDYTGLKERLRPGHADLTANIKYNEFHDYRGGGHFSGRLTAGIVFAGAVAKSILKESGIIIGCQIKSIGDVEDREITTLDEKTLDLLKGAFPVADSEKKSQMEERILEARQAHDSIGGKVRCFAINVPAGLGDPFFESFESVLSQLVFSIPAIKALEFGSGVELASMKGSEANDPYYFDENIKTRTNHNGGILGGITNGMPVDFTVTVKPTPSIGKTQESVNYQTKESVDLAITGRHDPCIVPRVLPVLEAVLAITILDRMKE